DGNEPAQEVPDLGGLAEGEEALSTAAQQARLLVS
ncbi:unnamed protein product, partial [Urochloa humidicola]